MSDNDDIGSTDAELNEVAVAAAADDKDDDDNDEEAEAAILPVGVSTANIGTTIRGF